MQVKRVSNPGVDLLTRLGTRQRRWTVWLEEQLIGFRLTEQINASARPASVSSTIPIIAWRTSANDRPKFRRYIRKELHWALKKLYGIRRRRSVPSGEGGNGYTTV